MLNMIPYFHLDLALHILKFSASKIQTDEVVSNIDLINVFLGAANPRKRVWKKTLNLF